MRIMNPSNKIRQKIEAQGHTIGEPDEYGKVIINLALEPELVIDNPDPLKTP